MSFVKGEMDVFDGTLSPSTLAATIQADAFEPGEAPTRIFDVNDDVVVRVQWTLTGYLMPCLCGSWECDVYLESIGEGEEFEVEGNGGNPIPYNSSTGQYSVDITIPAGRIHPASGETDIPYKMVATVVYRDQNNRPGPIAGFVELPLVQFYVDNL